MGRAMAIRGAQQRLSPEKWWDGPRVLGNAHQDPRVRQGQLQPHTSPVLTSGSRSHAHHRGGIETMRKLIVLSFITLDGVMQAPGGPEEDPTGGFTYGGWTVPYFCAFLRETMAAAKSRPFVFIVSRQASDIFSGDQS